MPLKCRPLIDQAKSEILKEMQQPCAGLWELQSVADYFCLEMAEQRPPAAAAMFLDRDQRFLAYEDFSAILPTNRTIVNKHVVDRSLDLVARYAILAEYPYPDAPNSLAETINATQELSAYLSIFDVVLLDHLIISGLEYTSLHELGHLKVPPGHSPLLLKDRTTLVPEAPPVEQYFER